MRLLRKKNSFYFVAEWYTTGFLRKTRVDEYVDACYIRGTIIEAYSTNTWWHVLAEMCLKPKSSVCH